MEDLDEAISHLTKSILLQPLSWLPHGSMIFQVMYFLAKALLMRSKLSNQPEDAIYATKYLFHLRDQPRVISDVPPHVITILLVDTLAFQVELETGNMMQNIREMAVLCHELLTSALNMSDVDTTRLIYLISKTMSSKIRNWVPDQPLDELIECLRAARKHRPDLLQARFALVESLTTRYCMTWMNDDYEEAVSILDEIVASSSFPGDSQDDSLAASQRTRQRWQQS